MSLARQVFVALDSMLIKRRQSFLRRNLDLRLHGPHVYAVLGGRVTHSAAASFPFGSLSKPFSRQEISEDLPPCL